MGSCVRVYVGLFALLISESARASAIAPTLFDYLVVFYIFPLMLFLQTRARRVGFGVASSILLPVVIVGSVLAVCYIALVLVDAKSINGYILFYGVVVTIMISLVSATWLITRKASAPKAQARKTKASKAKESKAHARKA